MGEDLISAVQPGAEKKLQNVNMLFKNDEKLTHLHKIVKQKFLVSNKDMGLCQCLTLYLFLIMSTLYKASFLTTIFTDYNFLQTYLKVFIRLSFKSFA